MQTALRDMDNHAIPDRNRMHPAPRYALFVQPHYDDVALSCGATAATWSATGCEPHIVTVFASEIVHAMVGSLAAQKHSRWQLSDPDEVHARRRAEDARAAAVLGCGIRWLGLPDAIYRGDRYLDDGALYGPLHKDEVALTEHLADELVSLPEWREGAQVFVPLAIGEHVDHQLVFEAGRHLARRGIEVWAYEDLPYAIHTPQARDRRLAQVEGVVAPSQALTVEGSALERKLAAIGCYDSQLPVIFRFTSDYRAAVEAHARGVGNGTPAERFWRLRR